MRRSQILSNQKPMMQKVRAIHMMMGMPAQNMNATMNCAHHTAAPATPVTATDYGARYEGRHRATWFM